MSCKNVAYMLSGVLGVSLDNGSEWRVVLFMLHRYLATFDGCVIHVRRVTVCEVDDSALRAERGG
jgi:hypothetical protein